MTQHNTTQHNTMQHDTTQRNATRRDTAQHDTTRHTTMQRNATNAMQPTQRNATQNNATQRNATQRNTTQRNATQHNTTQHNTTHPINKPHSESIVAFPVNISLSQFTHPAPQPNPYTSLAINALYSQLATLLPPDLQAWHALQPRGPNIGGCPPHIGFVTQGYGIRNYQEISIGALQLYRIFTLLQPPTSCGSCFAVAVFSSAACSLALLQSAF